MAAWLGLQGLSFGEGKSWLLGLLGRWDMTTVLTIDKLLLDCETCSAQVKSSSAYINISSK